MTKDGAKDGIIEYFYSAHSAFAYLGAWELERIARETGWQVEHRPFDFAPVMAAAGGVSFRNRTAAQIKYFFGRELVRWAQFRDLPMIRHRPTYHDNSLALGNGMIIASGADADALSRAVLQAHWRDDLDIANVRVMLGLADALSLDGPALVKSALSKPVQDRHRANTQEAIARGIFGSPTYFVRGDMFYGQDRLHMVERAIQMPFSD